MEHQKHDFASVPDLHVWPFFSSQFTLVLFLWFLCLFYIVILRPAHLPAACSVLICCYVLPPKHLITEQTFFYCLSYVRLRPHWEERREGGGCGVNKRPTGGRGTHHDDATWLVHCAHAHYRCHANRCTLEVDATRKQRTDTSECDQILNSMQI